MDRIDKIADDVSYLRGQFDSHLDSQKSDRAAQNDVNSRLLQLIEENQKRTDTLESRADKQTGFVAACSMIGGAVCTFLGTAVSKMLT